MLEIEFSMVDVILAYVTDHLMLFTKVKVANMFQRFLCILVIAVGDYIVAMRPRSVKDASGVAL